MKYKIGDWVQVTAKAVKYYEDDEDHQKIKTVKRFEYGKPIVGQIVGATYRFIGIVRPKRYDKAYLEHTGKTFVWKVCFGLFNKSVDVLENDICFAIIPTNHKLPFKYAGQPPWSDENREFLREIMKYTPRDKSGRWIKMEDQ